MQPQITDGKYYFTHEHEWVRFDGNYATVGLTTLARKELGRIGEIEIHTIGQDLTEQQVFGRIKTEKYLCKLIMPVRGKVVEANNVDYEYFNIQDTDVDPQQWIIRIAVAFPLNTEKLYTLEEYKLANTERALNLVRYFLRFGEKG